MMRGHVVLGRAGRHPLIAGRNPVRNTPIRIKTITRVAPPSQLSDSELAELVEENRQLRTLLETYVDRLPAEQVASLRRQYEEIRALAASNGVELEPLHLPGAGKLDEDDRRNAARAAANPSASAAAAAVAAFAAAAAAAQPAPATTPASAAPRPSSPAASSSGGRSAPVGGSSSSQGVSGSRPATAGQPVDPARAHTTSQVVVPKPAPPAAAQAPKQQAAKPSAPAPPKAEADHWIDQRGRYGEESDALGPTLTAEQKAAREAEKAALRAKATALVDSHDPGAVAADRHHWLVFTVPETPVAGADCVVYFNKKQSSSLGWSQRLHMQVGYNKWQLGGEKLPLSGSTIPHIDGSDFWHVRFAVPSDAYEINMVFGDENGNHDNNQAQDFTFATEGGLTFEEWVDGAADRAMKVEEEERARREVAEREAKAAAAAAALKRDEDEARAVVDELVKCYGWYREGALQQRKVEGYGGSAGVLYWTVSPSPVRAGGSATVLYNSKAGPLNWLDPAQGHVPPSLTYGWNNWRIKGAAPVEMKPSKTMKASDGELWWEAIVEVPPTAAAMSFCVNSGDCWDNNGGVDHKVVVSPPAKYDSADDPVATWAEDMLPGLRDEARSKREAHEAAEAAKAAKRAVEREVSKNQAMAVLRRQLKHVLFTEPEVPKAGEKVTVYYSPASTVLAGREQIYITAGFNRWGHLRKLGPAAMKPPGPGGMHHRATFMAPRDAHVLDIVLSDVPGGEGTYDNRGGLDYHIPIEGGVGAKPQPLHVVHIAVEMAPIAKVGGLGDVVTSLGRAVQDQGHLCEVMLPWYQFFNSSPLLQNRQFEAEFDWGGTRIVVTSCIVEGLRVFFVDPRNGFFATDSVYGRYDDEVRFDFFCKAALEFLLQTQRQPDILHCHDWQTAHVAKAYWTDYHPYGLWKPKVVFTIHNMNYGQKKIAEAACYSQKITTVSPTYAFEVGGHPALAGNTHKFMGILNGIDPELWDPQEDPWLPMPYDASTCEAGKAAARAELRKRLNLSGWDDKLIVSVVSRLTGQKGVPLIKHAAWRTRDRGGQFVLLGSAPDPKVQGEFNALAGQLQGGHDNGAAFCFYYDEPLSHLIYAAADIVVVPSMFEPCGLTQMIAMRYGAVPVVRHTGGLRDTVFDVDNDKPRAAWEVAGSSDWEADGPNCTNGFAFEGTDPGGLDYALNRAIDAYYNDKPWFRGLQSRVMNMDWSWNRPALTYVDLYLAATKQ